MLDDYRYHHSLCVAKEAVRLVKKYGGDEQKAYIAGILHDILKNTPLSDQLHWIKKSGIIFDSIQLASPPIWHGFAASAFIKEELQIADEDILLAVRYHTTGRAGMTHLEKIIYMADMTSADRSYKDVDAMRKKVNKNLDEALLDSLKFSVSSLAKKGLPIPYDTIMAYNELCVAKREESN
ncbi:bis(5'-nucleosyl)-tetraphosphatase (symmetrical) YqeK [Zongyangia hominis]|uniref:bis(5'-nucleosyl)-tetraphosphatase (symmetrical) n=1 Tax=Zongyangia hominis TaxID=2763677 RepID=A0A926E8Q0_9FIRM|nr:bis(5'-nucleosyl)-tetraphosphatase (symmetrical) YqeK [Zongyangia hominis]MBC8569263.1 bis(5'-nucleosyl)-tetraphosphatase (symmetrical) YqeK [Zongyangia hominis]